MTAPHPALATLSPKGVRKWPWRGNRPGAEDGEGEGWKRKKAVGQEGRRARPCPPLSCSGSSRPG